MSTPIEALARALCRRDGHPEDAAFGGLVMWQSYADEARRMLRAIRTPSNAMVVAGAECDSLLVRDIYSAMIDAAITEG